MTQTLEPQAPAQTMSVRYEGGERYEVTVRDHTIVADQPVDAGGSDSAPTPTELFVASLAGCVAFYAGRFLTRRGLSREGLGVAVTYRMAADRRARVADVHLTVRVPHTMPAHLRPALQAVVEHCTVHNSLITPPAVSVDLTE
jgi:putative redox protein